MSKDRILLRCLLLSTSSRNIYRHCKDKKKRGKIVGAMIGQTILYLMLMAYCVLNCIGYGHFGLAGSIPVMCATVIVALSFIFTFFKTNGYLFNFKEYDMIMSLPFTSKSIVACKFLYMYIKSLPWYLSVSVSMLAGYAYYVRPPLAVYPVWILLTFVLPVIPMVAASFLGFIIARIGSGFRNKTIIQTVLTMIFIIFVMFSRFFIEDMLRNDKTEDVLSSMSAATDSAGKVFLPIDWFRGAVADLRISDMLLLIGVSLILFEVVFMLVGRSYRKINSALRSHAARRSFVMSERKRRSVLNAIAFKEFKRMTGSTVYLTNGALGVIMCLVGGIVVLFLNLDKIIRPVLKDAPFTMEMLYPVIPLVIYFLIGMVATTVFTPSLEGKNYWIVQSLPISRKTLYQGKMLFNLYMTVPVTVFATAALCISARAGVVNTLLFIVTGILLCLFSTAWGCVCGIKHMRLDWENEVEVIKQGAAVTIYLLPNMFINMGLMVGVVALGTVVSPILISLGLMAAVAVLAALSYLRVLSLARE